MRRRYANGGIPASEQRLGAGFIRNAPAQTRIATFYTGSRMESCDLEARSYGFIKRVGELYSCSQWRDGISI